MSDNKIESVKLPLLNERPLKFEIVPSKEQLAIQEALASQPVTPATQPPVVKQAVSKRIVIPREKPRATSEVIIIGTSYDQCVTFYKKKSGITRSLGYAGRIPSQGNTPKVGAGALERSYGHISYVEQVLPDAIIVSEANFIRGKLTRRVIPLSAIRGYIYF